LKNTGNRTTTLGCPYNTGSRRGNPMWLSGCPCFSTKCRCAPLRSVLHPQEPVAIASVHQASPLRSGIGDPLHKLALREKVQDQDRHQHHHRRRHLQMQLGGGVTVHELSQPHRHRTPFIRLHHQQGPQQRIPRANEPKGDAGHDRRGRERDDDRPQETQVPRPIDAGGVPQIFGDLREELAQQKDRECRRHERDRQRGPIVDPPKAEQILAQASKPNDRQIVGDQRRHVGDHQCGDHDAEQDIAPDKFHPGEGIRRWNTDQQLPHQRDRLLLQGQEQ